LSFKEAANLLLVLASRKLSIEEKSLTLFLTQNEYLDMLVASVREAVASPGEISHRFVCRIAQVFSSSFFLI